MYAILQQGGHQYRVAPGDRLVVDRLDAAVGTVVALEPVLLVHDGDAATVGAPVVEGARVAAVVVGHTKGRRIRVFKYKPKKRYRRTHGHRSLLTELRVSALLGAGEALPAPPADASTPEAATDAPAAAAPTRGRRQASAGDPGAPSAPGAASRSTAVTSEAPEAEPDGDAAAEVEE